MPISDLKSLPFSDKRFFMQRKDKLDVLKTILENTNSNLQARLPMLIQASADAITAQVKRDLEDLLNKLAKLLPEEEKKAEPEVITPKE